MDETDLSDGADAADAAGEPAGGAGREFGATRRGLLGAAVVAGVGGATLTPLGTVLDRIAPPSGRAWRSIGEATGTVDSPFGDATLTYDEYGVSHVEADDELAAYYAVGYAQAADRLAQMDLTRRLAEGTLSEAVGAGPVAGDVFARKMGFGAAAEASRRAIEGTRAGLAAEAHAAGITAYVEEGDPGVEFGLLDYEPDEWTVRDSLLVLTRMAWQLSGGFEPLRRSVTRRTFDPDLHEQLYPPKYDHGAPIIRDGASGATGRRTDRRGAERGKPIDPDLVDWLGQFEPPEYVGSNAWTVSGEYTDTGDPIVASDPHLGLRAPPPLYEQRVTVDGLTVRGVTIPGIPFVVIGENDHGAWGLTNAGGVDVVDCYAYETDGERYRYGDEWREFDTHVETVGVSGGDDREVTVRRTVHGAFLDPDVEGDDRHVGVAWTGMGATRELQGLYRMTRSTGAGEFRTATSLIEGFPLNVHYADGDGNTLYQLAGRVPIRRVDGSVVPGDRVFDGSAGEADWEGFEPYGDDATWERFVPFEELPSVRDAGYVASANQRTVDDHEYPIELPNAPGFRAERIYDRLDEAAETGAPIDRDLVESIQLDTHNGRARLLVPAVLEARDRMPDGAEPWLDALEDWDYRMDRDSTAALVFRRLYSHFRRVTWTGFFEDREIGPRYAPNERVLLTLPPDSEVFDGDRGAVLAEAMERTIDEIDDEGWETYGDFNVTALDHPLGGLEPGLNYERHPTDGGPRTVRAFSPVGGFGACYRMVADLGGETVGVMPGGNDGSATSEHYDDQLRLWADGEYRRLAPPETGGPDVTFREVDG